MAWKFCIPEDVQELHNIEASSLKDSWSDMVEGLIMEYLGSPALAQDTTYTETHDGDGGYTIVIDRPPIKSVTYVKFNGSTIASTDYEVGKSTINLLYYKTDVDHKNIEVQYVSGADEVPSSVRLAAASMIAAVSNHYKRYGSDGSLRWADTEQSITLPSTTRQVGLITHLKSIMMSLLRRNKVKVR